MMKHKNQAFSLIELLVVIAIISLLVSILLPSLKKASVLARRAVCLANLSGIARSVYLYAQDCDEFYPDPYAMGAVGYRRRADGYIEYYGKAAFCVGIGARCKKFKLDDSGQQEQYGLMGALVNTGIDTPPAAWICPGQEDKLVEMGNTYWHSSNDDLGNKRLGDYTADELLDLGLLSDNHFYWPADSGVRGATHKIRPYPERFFPHASVASKTILGAPSTWNTGQRIVPATTMFYFMISTRV